MKVRKQRWFGGVVFAGLIAALPFTGLAAARFESDDYVIDASVSNSFGGTGSSDNYKMVSSGGEAIIGNGAGGSYKLGAGFVAQLEEDDTAQTIELTVQPTGLASYYPMDETTGAVVGDASMSDNHLAIPYGADWITGKVGGGIDFDGGFQHALLNSNINNFPGGDTQHTISAWVKVYAYPAYRSWMLLFGQPGSGAHHWLLLSDGTTQLGAWSGGQGTPTLPLSQWKHVAVTYDGTNVKVYIDGVVEETINDPATFNFTFTGTHVAEDIVGESSFNGAFDELKIFSRSLTAKEVKAEYEAGNIGIPSGLAFSDDIVPGTSETVSAEAVVKTSATAYTLAISQDGNLTSGGATIPPVSSGTIDSPVSWTEGTTKGLGFTLTSGSDIDPEWGTNPTYNYAAIPNSATSFHTRTGVTPAQKESLITRFRVDVDNAQVAGDYKNTVTYTGTVLP